MARGYHEVGFLVAIVTSLVVLVQEAQMQVHLH